MTDSERVGLIMDYESGTASMEQTIKLFADLIKTGMAWNLQGHYGRTATAIIDRGLISPEGDPDWDYINTLC